MHNTVNNLANNQQKLVSSNKKYGILPYFSHTFIFSVKIILSVGDYNWFFALWGGGGTGSAFNKGVAMQTPIVIVIVLILLELRLY